MGGCGRDADCKGCLQALRDTCDCGESHWQSVRDLGFDPLHRLVLDLHRCCCGGYSTKDLKLWDFALFVAMNELGVDHGAAMHGHILALAKTMRMERFGTFDFLTIRCSKITPDERELMAAITDARLDMPQRTRQAAETIVRCERCAATLVALEALGQACRRCEWYNSPAAQMAAYTGELH
ncbi:MAG: hypothetical protein AAF709_00930 [Pseudomonadota bacterium]